MADTLFLFLAMAAVTIVLWSPRPSWRACLAAGLLLGLSSTVRPTGLPLLAVFLVYLLVRLIACPSARCGCRCCLGGRGGRVRAGVRRAAGRLRGLVQVSARRVRDDRLHRGLPVLAGHDVRRLLAHVAADRPAAAVHVGAAGPAADRAGLHLDVGQPAAAARRADVLAHGQQARRAVRHPGHRGTAARLRARGLGRHGAAASSGTAPSSPTRRRTTPTCSATSRSPSPPARTGGYPSAAAYYVRGNPATVVVSPFAQVIRDYQRYVWLPGTVYGLILLVGLFGIARRWRRAGERGAAPLAVLARAGRGARRDGGVRLPVRHHRGAVRLPSRRDGVRPGGPHAPRRGRRP